MAIWQTHMATGAEPYGVAMARTYGRTNARTNARPTHHTQTSLVLNRARVSSPIEFIHEEGLVA